MNIIFRLIHGLLNVQSLLITDLCTSFIICIINQYSKLITLHTFCLVRAIKFL